jgi:hypothetical protein
MIRAACTIVSLNYLPYARVLCDSFLRFHPDYKFYVLLVDRLPADIDVTRERFELIPVEGLGIPDFPSVAFKYDILELNTAVKPTFLKHILETRGASGVIYLDPDIYVYSRFDRVLELLEDHPIVLTPHADCPIDDDLRPAERDFLQAGVFNLGFIAVANRADALAFLEWWENRCLTLGFSDVRNGYFVDQKWVNFAPCFCDGVAVLRDPGYNMAYWNLHGRVLEGRGTDYVVNGCSRLSFFHFSGIGIEETDRISKHTNRYSLSSRPDLRPLFESYRACIVEAGYNNFKSFPYAWNAFSDGTEINKLTRVLYSFKEHQFAEENPFQADSDFHRWARKMNLLTGGRAAAQYSSLNFNPRDTRIRLINALLRLVLRVFGADKYMLLMKYASYISVLRNQEEVFK